MASLDSFILTYKLGRAIAVGSHSTVYECQNMYNGYIFAVKIIPFQKAIYFDPFKEVSIMRKVAHSLVPKILAVYPANPDNYHIVMEKCPGITLGELLSIKGMLPQTTTIPIMQQLFEVLSLIHSKGFAHMDLNLDNIIYNPDNQDIKIVGFSFATDQYANCSKYWGKLAYASPEVLTKQQFNGQKQDIWAAGMIFYQLATCEFTNCKTESEQLKELMDADYDLPFAEYGKIARDLLRMALQKDPSERSTAQEILTTISTQERSKSNLSVFKRLSLQLSMPVYTKPKIKTNPIVRKC